MQQLTIEKKTTDLFVQGFRWGLIFGTIGALIMLGRQGKPETTL